MSEETECPSREDDLHCNCWYDGDKCCACGASEKSDEDRERDGDVKEEKGE